MVRSLLFSVIVLGTGVQFASADYVNSVAPQGDGSVFQTGDPTGNYVGSSNFQDWNVNAATGLDSVANFITVDLDVFATGLPMNFNVNTSRNSSGSGTIGSHQYIVTVNVTNMLGLAPPGNNPIQPGSTGKYIGPFDVLLTGLGAYGVTPPSFDTPGGLDGNQMTTNGGYYIEPNAVISPTHIRFGGLSGSGGWIAPGGTVSFTFALEIPQTSSGANVKNFNLQFVANPEPGSLALATILGAPLFYATRRRLKKRAAVKNAAV